MRYFAIPNNRLPYGRGSETRANNPGYYWRQQDCVETRAIGVAGRVPAE